MSKCKVCTKSVYPMDPQINLDGTLFHKPCAKCADCKCQITISNFTKGEQDGQLILLCKTHYFKRFKEGGSYVGGEKFQVKSIRDVQASSRRSSAVDSAPIISTTTTVTTNNASEIPASTASSVRDRIANIRSNEKSKTDNTPAVSQTSSRKPSIDVTKFSESKPNEPIVTSTPENVPIAAPATVSVVDASPSPVVMEVSTPVAAPVPEPAVTVVEAAVVSPLAPEPIPVKAEPASSPTEIPVNETVIDASPENGVSTPYIPFSEKDVDAMVAVADVPLSTDAAETESTSQSEESN